jgi:hypothetical protein
MKTKCQKICRGPSPTRLPNIPSIASAGWPVKLPVSAR